MFLRNIILRRSLIIENVYVKMFMEDIDMKKFLLPCIMCMLLVGDLLADPMYFLLTQKKVNVEFNYDHARVDNIDSTDFADLRQAVSCEWERLFLNELNDELDDFEIKFGDHTEAVYTMLVTCILYPIILKLNERLEVLEY